MPSNVEIKAKVLDPERLRTEAARISTVPGRIINQEDVFFRSGSGRLKLRIFSDDSGELIYYERPDTKGIKQSNYQIHITARPRELRRVLADAIGETVTVKKKRQLFMAGQTRIHIDEVEGLGTYMELEVVLEPGQTFEEGSRIADDLMRKLGVKESELVPCAYCDLIMMKAERASSPDAAESASQ
ncbi:MAG: class IV adenylate cyclase [bacterium]